MLKFIKLKNSVSKEEIMNAFINGGISSIIAEVFADHIIKYGTLILSLTNGKKLYNCFPNSIGILPLKK